MVRLVVGLVLILLLTSPVLSETWKASFYSKGYRTASGRLFKPNEFTAAHRNLPFGTKVKITLKGRTIIVTITDRGPYIKGRDVDLSSGAAQAIGCGGVCSVHAQILGK